MARETQKKGKKSSPELYLKQNGELRQPGVAATIAGVL